MLQYILALLTISVFVVLFIRKPQIETYVLYVILVLPLMNTKILPLAYGFVRTFDVITVLALLFLTKDLIKFYHKIQHKTYLLIGILFCCITVVSGLYSEFGFGTYYNYYPIFNIFIFVRFLYLFLNHSSKNIWLFLSAFKIAYIFALLFVSLQILIGPQISLYSGFGINVLDNEIGVVRYSGIFTEPQLNGQFLAMGSYLFLIYNSEWSQFKKYYNFFVFIISFLFILMVGSRSAMGGFLIGLIILFLFSNIRIKVLSLILGFLAAVIAYIAIPSSNGIISRSGDIEGDLDFRQSIWEETYGIIKEKPLLGIGLGNFQEYTAKYHQDLYLEQAPGVYTYFTQPENGYLKILVEHGLIAFGLFCLFFLYPFTKFAIKIFKHSINFNSIIIFAAICSWLIAFNTVYTLSDYRILIMVAFLLTVFEVIQRKVDRIII
ncbi:O-antigen ligase family protein [uncultured Maribacter sp.]|uniref:O-antigen ligase family protein n=1 Tax=uncultured Maribacter sp. TaxID=431308 RepID=UPI002638F826|nr:O-antigen ligase family protein [uncultured Maribacter sp.]